MRVQLHNASAHRWSSRSQRHCLSVWRRGSFCPLDGLHFGGVGRRFGNGMDLAYYQCISRQYLTDLIQFAAGFPSYLNDTAWTEIANVTTTFGNAIFNLYWAIDQAACQYELTNASSTWDAVALTYESQFSWPQVNIQYAWNDLYNELSLSTTLANYYENNSPPELGAQFLRRSSCLRRWLRATRPRHLRSAIRSMASCAVR